MLFDDEVAPPDLHAADPVAPLQVRDQLDQLDAVGHRMDIVHVADQQRQAVGDLDRVRPQPAHLADQMLRADRLHIAGGHPDVVHLAAGQKVWDDIPAGVGGEQGVWAEAQRSL